MSKFRRCIAVRNRIIFVKATEVIDPHHIIQLVAVGDPPHPPGILRLFMIFPAVQRIPPQLSRRRESIRRTASHCHRCQCIVQLKQFRVGPGVRTVKRHINRDITDDLYLLLIRVCLQCKPLLREQVLLKLIKFHFLRIFLAVCLHGLRPAELDILIPLAPTLPLKGILHRHI